MTRGIPGRGSLFAAVIFALLGVATVAQAFIGNINIGGWKAPCAIACGKGGGIVNFGFAGDAFRSFVTQPSIDDLSQKFDALGQKFLQDAETKLNAVLDKKLEQLDKLATAQQDRFFAELNETTKTAASELDGVLRDNIRNAASEVQEAQAKLEGNVTRSANSFNSALVLTATIAITLGVIAALVLKIRRKKISLREVLQSAVIAVGIFMLGAGASWGYDVWQRKKTKSSYRDDLVRSAQASDLHKTVYFATRLIEFDPQDEDAQAEVAAAQIYRDLHHRPTSYKRQNDGQESLQRALRAQSRFISLTKKRNPNLDAVISMLLWQLGDDRYAEYLSARFAYATLSNKGEHLDYGGKAVARYYLTLFLQTSPSEVALQSLTQQRESQIPDLSESPVQPPPVTLAKLRDVAAGDAAGVGDDFPKANKALALNLAHVKAIDLYSRLILAHAQAVAATDQAAKGRHDNLRTQIALRIEAMWREIHDGLNRAPSTSGLIMLADTFHQSAARASAIRMTPPWLNPGNDPISIFENADFHELIDLPGFGPTLVSKPMTLQAPTNAPAGTPPLLAPPVATQAKQLRCLEYPTGPLMPGMPIAISGVTPGEVIVAEKGDTVFSRATRRSFEQAVRLSSDRMQQKLRFLEGSLVLSELPPNTPIRRCPHSNPIPVGPIPGPAVTPLSEQERESRRAAILSFTASLGLLICAEKASTDAPCERTDSLIPLSDFIKARYESAGLRYSTSPALSDALTHARDKRVSLRF